MAEYGVSESLQSAASMSDGLDSTDITMQSAVRFSQV